MSTQRARLAAGISTTSCRRSLPKSPFFETWTEMENRMSPSLAMAPSAGQAPMPPIRRPLGSYIRCHNRATESRRNMGLALETSTAMDGWTLFRLMDGGSNRGKVHQKDLGPTIPSPWGVGREQVGALVGRKWECMT